MQVLEKAYQRECNSSTAAGLAAGQQLAAALVEAVLDADLSAQFPPLLVSCCLVSAAVASCSHAQLTRSLSM